MLDLELFWRYGIFVYCLLLNPLKKVWGVDWLQSVISLLSVDTILYGAEPFCLKTHTLHILRVYALGHDSLSRIKMWSM